MPRPPAEPAAGVTAYPAAFFAQYQPGNAREMLERVPGCSWTTAPACAAEARRNALC